ncbi:heme oxygenase (biliverdin-producing) [Dermacoccaceae bacterium W4C1]
MTQEQIAPTGHVTHPPHLAVSTPDGEHHPHHAAPEPASESGFARRLREQTSAMHRHAEGASFVERLMNGELDAVAVSDMLTQLRPIYAAVDEVGRGLQNVPPVSGLWDEGLTRTAAIDHDLATLPAPRSTQIVPAAAAYAARVRQTESDPVAYLAHHYQRYLGDLSGGQILQRMMTRHYGIAPLAFYTFSDIPKVKVYKDRYREGLDAAIVGDAAQQRFIAEVNEGYLFNRNLFTALGKLSQSA